ncbi:MAG: hypothetical protein ACR2OD_02400 [Gaiellaceae bacterium]
MTPFRILIVVGALIAAFAALAPAAHARTACVDRILDEWVHPSQSIATTHALRCYDLALTEAPEDVLLYTEFETDVRTAKQAAIRERREAENSELESPAGGSPPPTAPPSAPPAPIEPGPAPAPLEQPDLVIEPDGTPDQTPDTAEMDPLGVDEAPQEQEVVPLAPGPDEPPRSEAVDAPVIDVLRNIGPNDARSIPVPLIVLAILSGLLAIVGATLLAARHVQSKRLSEGPPLPPRRRGFGSDEPDL